LGEHLPIPVPGGNHVKIGLEIHLQLPTASKLFCSCSTSGDGPNTSVCPTCLGFPGSRPRLNRRALEMGIRVSKFLGCRIADTTWFSRKTYFYPDLPKNFQITQYESPLGVDGRFSLNGKVVRITRVHLEEDPGRIKRVGKSGEEVSLIDYNRSGIPLVEIVTAPDIASPTEARDFMADILIELRYLVGLSEKDEQTVRVDANISIGDERVEIKNILGLKNLERALSFEASRQTKMLKAGKKIARETRHFDEERKVTISARGKESEEDYGYIAEPDLGIFNVAEMTENTQIPETPLRRAKRIGSEYTLDRVTARQIVMTSSGLADLFERLCTSLPSEAVATWILGPLSSNWNVLEKRMDERLLREIEGILQAVVIGKITDSEARRRIDGLQKGEGVKDIHEGEEKGELGELVNACIDENPEVLSDFRTNKRSANFVIGQIIRQTKGKYGSGEIVEVVNKEIEKRLKEKSN